MTNKKGFAKETARAIVCAIENVFLPIWATINKNGGVKKKEKRTKQIGDVLFVEYHVLKTPTLDSIQTTFTICPNNKTTN